MDKYTQQNAAQMEKILKTSATTGLSLSNVSAAQSLCGKNLVFPKNPTSFFSFLKCLLKRISFYVMLVSLVLVALSSYIAEACSVAVVYLLFLGLLYLV